MHLGEVVLSQEVLPLKSTLASYEPAFYVLAYCVSSGIDQAACLYVGVCLYVRVSRRFVVIVAGSARGCANTERYMDCFI